MLLWFWDSETLYSSYDYDNYVLNNMYDCTALVNLLNFKSKLKYIMLQPLFTLKFIDANFHLYMCIAEIL